MANKNQYLCVLIMGLPGSGKTTVAKILSKQLKAVFIEADDHHSIQNIIKMSKGHPLTDLDRKKWLSSIFNKARESLKSQNVVIACSALKEKYRKSLISFPVPQTSTLSFAVSTFVIVAPKTWLLSKSYLS